MSIWAKTKIPAGTLIAATYVYTDEQGTPVYKKERYEWMEGTQRKKMFKLRGFLGYAGGHRDRPQWDASLDKAERRVPYHLDLLRQAIAAKSDRVFLVDGEKDVETLERFGYVATTTPMGTMGIWWPEWAGYFYGAKRVTVIADKDEDGKGARDAWHVAKSLRRLGILVEVLQVPEGKDITDFLSARAA